MYEDQRYGAGTVSSGIARLRAGNLPSIARGAKYLEGEMARALRPRLTAPRNDGVTLLASRTENAEKAAPIGALFSHKRQ